MTRWNQTIAQFTLALSAAYLLLTATAASAAPNIPGSYALEGDITAYGVEVHPNASFVGPAGAHMESSPPGPPIVDATPPSYGYFTNLRFNPSELVKFGVLQSLSFDYEIVSGGFGGGSLRAFLVVDINNNGIEEIGANGAGNPNAMGDDILVVTPYLVDTIGYPAPGTYSTGNLLNTPNSDTDAWYVAYGSGLAPGAPLTSGNYTFSAIKAAYANYNVLSLTVVHDAINNAVFEVQNLSLTPEPASLTLIGLGGMLMLRRTRRSA